MKRIIVFLFLLLMLRSEAQVSLGSGYYSSETECFSEGGNFFLLRKKYVLADTASALPVVGQKSSSYIDLPVDVFNAQAHGRPFQTQLECYSADGQLRWKHIGGTSSMSRPDGYYFSKRHGIFLGGQSAENAVSVSLIDTTGKVRWTFSKDSLENVHDIIAAGDTVYVMASYNWTKKKMTGKNSFELVSGFVYHLIRLKSSDGKLIDDRFEPYSTYYGELGYEEPVFGDGGIVYLSKDDTMLYCNPGQKKVLMLSHNQMQGKDIITMDCHPGMYEVLMRSGVSNYELFLDCFGCNPRKDTTLSFTLARSYGRVEMMHRDSLGIQFLFSDGYNLRLQRWSGELKPQLSYNIRLEVLKSDLVSSACINSNSTFSIISVVKNGRKKEFWLHRVGADGRTIY